MAGDTLELGFVSSLSLQSLSVEYFGHPYVPPQTSLVTRNPLASLGGGR